MLALFSSVVRWLKQFGVRALNVWRIVWARESFKRSVAVAGTIGWTFNAYRAFGVGMYVPSAVFLLFASAQASRALGFNKPQSANAVKSQLALDSPEEHQHIIGKQEG